MLVTHLRCFCCQMGDGRRGKNGTDVLLHVGQAQKRELDHVPTQLLQMAVLNVMQEVIQKLSRVAYKHAQLVRF